MKKNIISCFLAVVLFLSWCMAVYGSPKTILGEDFRVYNEGPTIFLHPESNGETVFWIGVRENSDGQSNDSIYIGTGVDKATGDVFQMDKDGNLIFPTIDTGQGQTEVYPMDQPLRSTDSPEFVTSTLSGLDASKPVFTDGSKGLTSSGTVPIDQGGTGQTTAPGAFNALKQDATEGATGVVELSTNAEAVSGTDTNKAVTPANMTARMAAPGPIGGSTPSTGAFTTITASTVNGATIGQDINALEGLTGVGLVSRTSDNAYAEREIVGNTNEITVTNGDGISGNPTLSVDLNKDIVTTAPLTGGVDNVLVGADSDITFGLTLDKNIVAGTGLTGGADNVLPGSDADITLSHEDTSSQASVDGSGRTYIQDVTLDDFGHVTGLTTGTETVVDTDTWRGIDDVPVDGVVDESITSNWAYDHANASNPHSITKTTVGLENVPNTDIAYSSPIAAGDFDQTEVDNLRAGHLDDGTTPWTNASNITAGILGTAYFDALSNLGGGTGTTFLRKDGEWANAGEQTITLSGDASGTGTTAITVTVADDSHAHIIGNVDGLQTALDGKSPTAHTQAASTITDFNTEVSNNSSVVANTAKTTYPSADSTKVGFISITQAVNLDTIESNVSTNNGKISNATHTGEVTGSGALTVADNVIDAGNLKVTGNGTTSQYLRSDGDGTFTWVTPPDNNTTYPYAVNSTGSSGQVWKSDGSGRGVWGTDNNTTANQTITLSGDVTGSGTTSISTVVGNDSHTHTAGTISGLGAADISGLGTADFSSANISQWTNNSGYITDGNTNWNNSYGYITDGNTNWNNSYGYITSSGSITGNAGSVDGQSFAWSNSSNSPTYLWSANSNGSAFLAARGSISVNYANYSGYTTGNAASVDGYSMNQNVLTSSGPTFAGLIVNSTRMRLTENTSAASLSTNGEFAVGKNDTGNTGGRVWVRSGGYTFRFISYNNAADYSEFFYAGSDSAEPGDVIVIDDAVESTMADTGKVKKSDIAYQNKVIGVVTAHGRGTGFNNPDDDRQFDKLFANVGLLGHIHTKVSTINGEISIGDPLTSSSISGVAMKATESGYVIGKALAPYRESDPNKVEKILAYINVTWFEVQHQEVSEERVKEKWKRTWKAENSTELEIAKAEAFKEVEYIMNDYKIEVEESEALDNNGQVKKGYFKEYDKYSKSLPSKIKKIYYIDEENGEVRSRDEHVYDEITKIKYVLKDSVRFDSNTGKFFKIILPEESFAAKAFDDHEKSRVK